jgi:hypothetical protein
VIMSGGDIMTLSPANRTSIPSDVHWPEKYAPTPTNPTRLGGHSPSFITHKITRFWTNWLPWAKYQLLVTTIGSKEYNCRNLHTKHLDLCARLIGYCVHQHWLTWLKWRWVIILSIMIFGVFIMSTQEPTGLLRGFVECVGLTFSLNLFEHLFMARLVVKNKY